MITKKMLGSMLSLLMCACLLSACSNPEKDKLKYYQKALQYIDQEKRPEAVIELQNAIQIDAKYGEAHYQLGLLYLKSGDPKKAFGELVRAADLSPENLDAHAKVALFYLLSGKREESRKQLDHILEKNPTYRDALALLANLELNEKKFTEALAALQKTGEELDKSDELQLIKGRIHAAQEQWGQAEEAFRKAIAINGESFANYKILLQLYDTRKDNEKAKKLLDEMLAKFPDNAEAHLLLAGFHRSAGNIEKAGEELNKVIAIDPKNPLHRLQLADFYQKTNNFQAADETLTKARADIPKNPDIIAALATLYFDQGKFDNAQPIFDELKKDHAGHGGTRLLEARFLLKGDKVRESLPILQSLNKDFPAWADPFFYLGMAHYSLGEVDLAQKAVAEAIQKNGGDSQYHTFMAQLFLAKSSFEDAKKEAAIAIKLKPNNLRSAIILSRALIGAKQYDQAVTILADMNKQVPGNPEILGNFALASLGAGDRTKAEGYLTDLLAIDPAHTQAIGLLINLKYRDNLPAAESFIRQQIAKVPADTRLYVLLGGILQSQKKDQEALAAFEKAQELNPENIQAVFASAKLLTKVGKSSEAMVKFNTMIQHSPKSIPGLMGMAALYEAEGNTSKAMEQYTKVLEIKGDNAQAANNLAWLIVSDPAGGDIGKALMLAMTAKQALPDDPNIADTLGWVHYHRASYSLAIAQFEFALQNRPDDPVITYHLALAQKGNQQLDESVKTLERLLARNVEFPERRKAETLLGELKNR